MGDNYEVERTWKKMVILRLEDDLEDEGSRFLQNFGTRLLGYTTS
jgi:hypothetical protein